MSDSVLYEFHHPGTAVITLNRPDRLNAVDAELHRRYFDMLDRAMADPEVKVVVVTGAGRGFCAGADMGFLQQVGEEIDSLESVETRPEHHITILPKPVIAAINGPAAGIGFVMALMCDLRFAAKGAKLTTAFSRLGLIAEYGTSWMLPRLVGTSRAMDLLLSGRVVLAEDAHAMGLVDEVVDADGLLDRVMEYAADLALNASPTSMAVIKRQIYLDQNRTLDDASRASQELMAESMGRSDFKEGVSSYLEKRRPVFTSVDIDA